MPMIPKTKRNKELVKKRESNPAKWTFRALATYFQIDLKTAHDLYRIWAPIYGKEAEVDN